MHACAYVLEYPFPRVIEKMAVECSSTSTASSDSKRQREWDISDIEVSKHACVHGVVTDLSPLKKSRKNKDVQYFHSQLSDGKTAVKVLSFDRYHRPQFEEALQKESAVVISECAVQHSKLNPANLEVLLSPKSTISTSPRKFLSAKRQLKLETQTVNLREVCDLSKGQGHIKPVNSSPSKVSSGLGPVEEDVRSLQLHKSYILKDVVVRRYLDAKFLSMGL